MVGIEKYECFTYFPVGIEMVGIKMVIGRH